MRRSHYLRSNCSAFHAFLGCARIDLEDGMLDVNFPRRQMLKSAIAVAGLGVAASKSPAARAAGKTSVVPARPRGGVIETKDGTALFCRDWGAGRPVVFLHSALLNSSAWGYQMLFLQSQGLRCVAYDRRGHGRSSDPGHGYDYDTLADDLAEVMNRLDLRDAVLVGHSMGGGEVVRYLSRHGSRRVAGIVLVASATPFLLKTGDNPLGTDEKIFAEIRTRWENDLPGWIDQALPAFVNEETSAGMRAWVVGMAQETSLLANAMCSDISNRTDFRAELKRIDRPALIIHGEKDVSVPLDQTGRATASLIRGSRLEIYEGAPHGLFITHRDRLNRDLLAFARNG
jgi:non-heme chloroperoxidase